MGVTWLLSDGIYSAGSCRPLWGPFGWREQEEVTNEAMLGALFPQYLHA
jgi:hypothetical protein